MKSRVLFILHLPPPIHGAAMMGKYIQESELINSSFDCYCVNLATAGNLADIGHVSLKKLLKYLFLLKRIFHIVREIRPELVYITPNSGGKVFFKDFIVVRMLKSMGCNVIVHYHNKGVSVYQNKWLYNFLYKYFFSNLKVILLAEHLYKDIIEYVKWEDVYICPNGIPNLREGELEARRNNKVPYLLFLSNLLINKGVFVLLDALRILKEKGYLFNCLYVGGETAEINAMQFAVEVERRKLNDKVAYVGRKVGEEKNTFFQQADMFILPTMNECFPLVILEAMEYKLPVISTNEGGIPDIVKDGENGLICEKQNPYSLADCIAKLLDDEELRVKMGNAGYDKFCREFTLQRFENRMLGILSQNLPQKEKEN
ncbi:glycosyltransferase family 4 protein [Phocaeicola vulgatus]|jgi:glycosyltransferase involved in cell wall biosynthesis|uniref:glycosyltransferase family 4 protein n=1 Tax=Phocaeicola vulgatus TaxID=821 RepID=UPI00189F3A60|nr:glycosyltransferase family 4 protein [Phocaeicola vulgatus]MDC1722474.1 glycosyltransferase family 4 protein [Phocaeicola vulgatus]MDC1738616.1 glycosyltransferase family 4 protein [Phocaeicola vulgatus]